MSGTDQLYGGEYHEISHLWKRTRRGPSTPFALGSGDQMEMYVGKAWTGLGGTNQERKWAREAARINPVEARRLWLHVVTTSRIGGHHYRLILGEPAEWQEVMWSGEGEITVCAEPSLGVQARLTMAGGIMLGIFRVQFEGER